MKREDEIMQAAEKELKDCPYINTTLIGVDLYLKAARWADRTMIAKACELYRKDLQCISRMMGKLRKGANGIIEIEKSVEQFKKTLEQ